MNRGMVYNYKCRDCGEIFEVAHSMMVNNAVEELGLTCQSCNSQNIFKYLGKKPVPVHFKGAGFAINDLALDRIGFPKHYKENPEIRKKLEKM